MAHYPLYTQNLSLVGVCVKRIGKNISTKELFVYFTGHGFQHERDFYLCASDFDAKRPNATGLSTDELHALLRLAKADLVVKVIDACNSGILLVKDEATFQSHEKQGFKNLIQISSCRENQYSLTGESLSVFTEQFRGAALRKHEGTVYYTDIVNSLSRYSPDDIQIRGRRTTDPPPWELRTLRSPPMRRLWRADQVRNAIWQSIPPSRRTSPIVFTSPLISSAYAGTGLGRRSSIKLKIFWNKLLGTATSANWNVTYRP